MKKFGKFSVLALSAIMLIGCAACDSGGTGTGEGDYTDPNTVFTTYDNVKYNEYLMGDDAVIDNQWEGYGIGDPFVMRWNGKYYLYCSSLDTESGVRGYVSADLINWTPMTGEGLKTGYVSTDSVTVAAYAPEVYYFNGTFYMYTSPGGNGHYILTSDSPEGPFVKATNNFGLSIDGSVLIDDDESLYFTYAGNSGIQIAKMTDMLTVDAMSTPVLNGTSIGGWTEGSYILKRDGIYYLTYTGNHVASDGYRIAYATAENIVTSTGSLDRTAFTRAANNPLALETESELKGIGHSSTVMGPDMDSYYLVYHYLNSSGGPNRSLGIDRLTFNGKMMSVTPLLEGSITPTLPAFYANGTDADKFDTDGAFALSKLSAEANFTAEFNLKGASKATYVFGYTDSDNYCNVAVDLAAKTVKLNQVVGGTSKEIATGTLVNDFSADDLHTIRVSARDGLVDVIFDNMTKIDDAKLTVSAGKIGYQSLADGAEVGYTAFSNVAMGMSDQAEAKQATGYIGAATYLTENTYNNALNLGNKSGLSVLEDYPLEGVSALTLGANGDYASYLVNFTSAGRYGLELVYPASYGGKKIGVRLGDGTVYRCTLPDVDGNEEYVQAIVGEFNVQAGITTVRLENVGSEIEFAAFRFTQVSAVTPSFENDLSGYVQNGVDYKTIWKLKDGGHYAKAGTRQIVYFGDNTITDFTLEVEIKLEGATGTSTAGIVFHAKNYAASSYDSYMSLQGYYLSVNNNYVRLQRLNYADGTSDLATNAASNPFKTSDEFIPLKIQVRGNTVTVWSGETQLVSYSDSWAFTSGKIGLYTNGAAVVFRNLKIYE